jgi:hypothetical protein
MIDEARRQLLSKAVLALPIGAAAVAAADTVQVHAQPRTTQSLTTLLNTFVPGVGGFIGTLTLTGFSVVDGVLQATGTLAGNVLDGAGNLVKTINQTVSAPVSVSGSCQILSLTLGPLHLNLLGLVVDLNQVVLNITAVPGAGNLLGNLLCAVANLLNSGGPLSNLLNGLSGLLNQILGAL